MKKFFLFFFIFTQLFSILANEPQQKPRDYQKKLNLQEAENIIKTMSYDQNSEKDFLFLKNNFTRLLQENKSREQTIKSLSALSLIYINFPQFSSQKEKTEITDQLIKVLRKDNKGFEKFFPLALLSKGLLLQQEKKYNLADLYYDEGIAFSQKNKIYNFITDLYNIKGNMYEEKLQYYEKAISYYDSAMVNIKKNIKEPKYLNAYYSQNIFKAQANIKIYLDTKNPTNLTEAEKLLNIIFQNKIIRNYTSAYSLLSLIYYLKNDYKKSQYYINLATKKEYYEVKDTLYNDNLINGIKALNLIRLGDEENALKLVKSIEVNNINHILKLLLFSELYTIEKNRGNYEKALLYQEEMTKINENNNFLNYRLKVRELEQKNKESKREVEINKLKITKRNLIIFIIIIANIVFIILAYYYYQNRKKKKKLEMLQNEIRNITNYEKQKIEIEKEFAVQEIQKKISTQLHNDIGATLVTTINFFKVKRKIENKESDLAFWDALIEDLQKIYANVRTKSHELHTPVTQNKINDFLQNLEKNINLVFKTQDNINLSTAFKIAPETELSYAQKLIILSTLKEGCSNIVKHSNAKNVDIKLTENQEEIILEIENDDKKKRIKTPTKSYQSGMGLQMLKNEIESNNGTLITKNNSGFLLKVVLKK
ncbi:sensor histidine kinase [Chryseobacterium binzhouense]|uniref:sensor histidine kinase n=1 Tax=Chryseobacterium binzhouense TaxID=2593646 RepID=UPI0011803937|nr:hypothetical protein [Chryseobacterium binzhouense]